MTELEQCDAILYLADTNDPTGAPIYCNRLRPAGSEHEGPHGGFSHDEPILAIRWQRAFA